MLTLRTSSLIVPPSFFHRPASVQFAMHPLDPRRQLPPGRLVSGHKTCTSCNSLLANPDSLAAILSEEPPFRYCRRYDDLESTSNAGCILCLCLIDRHIQLGPAHVPPSDVECGVNCHCIHIGPGEHLVFTVQGNHGVNDDDGGLRSLLFEGKTKEGEGETWNLRFGVEAPHDSPAARYVPTRPVELDVGSSQAFDMARGWLHECLNTHSSCPKQSNVGSPLPTRVIEVCKTGQFPRLYVSNPKEIGDYIALSYCWGGSQPACTTTETFSAYTDSIPLGCQPQTIQDAIRVTGELGIKYLWVDSLCIVQDDKQDKAKEIATMGSVYENAIFTLSAASARSSTEGFLHRRRAQTHPITSLGYRSRDCFSSFKMDYCCPNGRHEVSIVGDQPVSSLDDPIMKRAWTFQEALLSPRCLAYSTTQVVWRCHSTFETAGGSLSWWQWKKNAPLLDLEGSSPISQMALPSKDLRVLSMFTLGNDVFDLSGRQATRQRKDIFGQPLEVSNVTKIHQRWMDTVSSYTSRQLTDPSDKLHAIAGIARKFGVQIGGQYCAGLWRSEILDGLAWQRSLYGGETTRTNSSSFDDTGPAEKRWRTPSWSWASINGPVSYWDEVALSTMDPMAKIVDVFVENLNDDPFGNVFWGELMLEGWLRRVDIESITEADWSNPVKFKRDELRFADVFIRSQEDGGRRCGSAVLDESIDGIIPYWWSHEHGLDEVYALPLYKSNCWSVNGGALRVHGILVLRWPVGNYSRIGWFDSFANHLEDAKPWVAEENYYSVQLV